MCSLNAYSRSVNDFVDSADDELYVRDEGTLTMLLDASLGGQTQRPGFHSHSRPAIQDITQREAASGAPFSYGRDDLYPMGGGGFMEGDGSILRPGHPAFSRPPFLPDISGRGMMRGEGPEYGRFSHIHPPDPYQPYQRSV